MTGWQWLAVAALGLAAIVAAYLAGTAHAGIDDDSFWRGYAEGQADASLDLYDPSPN